MLRAVSGAYYIQDAKDCEVSLPGTMSRPTGGNSTIITSLVRAQSPSTYSGGIVAMDGVGLSKD